MKERSRYDQTMDALRASDLVPQEWATRECKGHHKPLLLPGCQHCAEDEKVLEERIEAVVDAILPVAPDGVSSFNDIADRREKARLALRFLAREIRRG